MKIDKTARKIDDIVLMELENDRKVSKYSNSDLADYLINNIWSKEKWGSENCAVLDRVIQKLYDLDK